MNEERTDEIDRLRHDIERMQEIDSEHLAEIDRLRAEMERVRESFIDQLKLKEQCRLLRVENAKLRELLGGFTAPLPGQLPNLLVAAKDVLRAEHDGLHIENDRLQNVFLDFNVEIDRLRAELEEKNSVIRTMDGGLDRLRSENAIMKTAELCEISRLRAENAELRKAAHLPASDQEPQKSS